MTSKIDIQRLPFFLKNHFKLCLGILLTSLTLLSALLYIITPPWPLDASNIANKLQSPNLQHWLGTDIYGRDTLTMLMGSAYNALYVGAIAVGIGMTVGVSLGMLAAFKKGWPDSIIMRLCDFLYAFPAILLAILFTALLGSGITNAIVAIGIANIPTYARLTRNTVRTILPKDFIRAAKALGRTSTGIVRAHICPNLLPLLIIQSSIQLSLAILAEATLTYLGLGTQPPQPSWGRMLNEAQTLLFNAPMLAIIPGCTLALTILGLNQLGDGLRDLLTPKQRPIF